MAAGTAATAQQGLGGFADMWQHIVNDFSNIGTPSALAAFGQVAAGPRVTSGNVLGGNRSQVFILGVLVVAVSFW